MSMTSAPCAFAPAANAATSSGEDGRMSWPTTMLAPAAPTTRTKAAPRRPRDLGVELVGDEAADVVGLDDLGQIALLVEHVGEPTGGCATARVRRSAAD